ncbi:MAG: zinc-ribbon domain-containing protein [Candidatus Thorarchaeota archaeon]
MAFVVPIIPNKRKSKSSIGAVLTGLLCFLIFGIMFFLFYNRSGLIRYQFTPIFMIGGFSVFFMIIIGISITVAATSKSYNAPRNKIFDDQYGIHQKNVNILNPYTVPRPTEGKNKEHFTENTRRDIPVLEEVIYCRYCGAKRDKDAIFCHMCGTKL